MLAVRGLICGTLLTDAASWANQPRKACISIAPPWLLCDFNLLASQFNFLKKSDVASRFVREASPAAIRFCP
jgi:hypothetical protein